MDKNNAGHLSAARIRWRRSTRVSSSKQEAGFRRPPLNRAKMHVLGRGAPGVFCPANTRAREWQRRCGLRTGTCPLCHYTPKPLPELVRRHIRGVKLVVVVGDGLCPMACVA